MNRLRVISESFFILSSIFAKIFLNNCIYYKHTKGGFILARQQIYRKLSVLFYEKDRELVEELEKLSIEREDSMSKIVKQLISKELEQMKKG